MSGNCIDSRLVASARRVMAKLKRMRLTVATAESCTAGLIAAVLAHGEGASDILHGGFVTYTKSHKTRALAVPARLLKAQGSVTAGVAEAMARGALKHSLADIAIAVTGVLGPSPDEDGNPVGLVYISCAKRGARPRTERKRYKPADSDKLRRRVMLDALKLLGSCAA